MALAAAGGAGGGPRSINNATLDRAWRDRKPTLAPGAKVYWSDPDDMACAGMYEIVQVMGVHFGDDPEDVFQIRPIGDGGGSLCCAFRMELS